jgi:hypothetical protein
MHENMNQLERTRELLREAIRRSGSATPEQLRQLHELARQIVALRRESEMLEKAKDRKLAKLTAEELRKRLEQELRERKVAEMELEEQRGDLDRKERELRNLRNTTQGDMVEQVRRNERLIATNAALQRQNEETARELRNTAKELRSTEKELRNTEKELHNTEKELRGTEKELRGAEKKLGDTEKALRGTEKKLGDTEKELRGTEKKLGDTEKALVKAESELGSARTQLKAREHEKRISDRDIAALRTQISNKQRVNDALRMQLRASQKKEKDQEKKLVSAKEKQERDAKKAKQLEIRIATLETELKEQRSVTLNSIRDLQKARKEREEVRLKLKAEETKVKEKDNVIRAEQEAKKVAVDQLKEANRKLSNRVLQCYGAGVAEVKVDIREERILRGEIGGGGTFYLPYIDLGGKTFVVGHVTQFTGDTERNSLAYKDVTLAELTLSIPGVKRSTVKCPEPVRLANADIRMAAIPVGIKARKALRALTKGELKDRGVEGLFLFKATSPGKDFAELSERCSMDLGGELYVRNSGGRELRAEPGDLILSRAGEFVGIVAEVDSAPGSRKGGDQVRVFVAPDAKVWDDAKTTIAYARRDGDRHYTDFANTARKLRNELRKPKRRKR